MKISKHVAKTFKKFGKDTEKGVKKAANKTGNFAKSAYKEVSDDAKKTGGKIRAVGRKLDDTKTYTHAAGKIKAHVEKTNAHITNHANKAIGKINTMAKG